MVNRQDKAAATRQALITAGRRLFAARGYSSTSTEELLAAAGVSRGALYHHFENKEALFRAVYEDVERDLTDDVVGVATKAKTPLAQLERGLRTFLRRCLDEEVQRIALLDGPSVLGWDTWHEIETRYAFGSILAALGAAVDAGELPPQPVEPLAHAVFGAMLQAGSVVARSPDPARAEREMAAMFKRLLDALRQT